MDASPNFPQFTRQHKIIILNINFSSFVCAQQSQPREHRFNDSFGLEGKRDDVGDFVEIFSFEGQRSRPAIIPLRWTKKSFEWKQRKLLEVARILRSVIGDAWANQTQHRVSPQPDS